MTPSKLLQVKDLCWSVEQKKRLDSVSFHVNSGEILGIVGPNGAGKTSLLKCIYGEYRDYEGGVQYKNRSLRKFSPRELAQHLAVVSQMHDSIFNLSVFDVVHMGLTPHKDLFSRDTQEDLSLINHALTRVDLDGRQHQTINTLSGGEQQRCLIARALVQQPDLLILDEPTNHLDVYYQHQILALLKNLKLSLILTIHDLNLAAQYCDSLLLLDHGQVKAFDSVSHVFTEEKLEQVFRLPCKVDTHPFKSVPRVTFAFPDQKRSGVVDE